MMRLLSWFRLRSFTTARRLALNWTKDSEQLVQQFSRDRKQLIALEIKLNSLQTRLDNDLRRAEELEQEHKTVVEALRSEIQVLADSTVPALVASHALLISRYEAETALEVRKSLALRGNESGE